MLHIGIGACEIAWSRSISTFSASHYEGVYLVNTCLVKHVQVFLGSRVDYSLLLTKIVGLSKLYFQLIVFYFVLHYFFFKESFDILKFLLLVLLLIDHLRLQCAEFLNVHTVLTILIQF